MFQMRRLFLRLAPVLHLSRVTTAFAAVGNHWFVILWTISSTPDEPPPETFAITPTWAMLGGAAVVSVALYAFAAILNDTLDLRRDRVLHPLRPLPSGRLNVDAAILLLILALIAAASAATLLGPSAVVMTLLTAGAVFFYNAAAKFVPSVGLVALSLIYAAHMLIPNMDLKFLWPVWLAMTHALLVGAVTHRLSDRRPPLSMAAVVAATLGWAFWSAMLMIICHQRNGTLWPAFVSPWTAAAPVILAGSFLVFAGRKIASTPSRARAADKVTRYGALWLTLYDTAWLAGAGHMTAALILGALTAAGFLGMTLLREMYVILEQPLAYRR